jgi:hypothetical protein
VIPALRPSGAPDLPGAWSLNPSPRELRFPGSDFGSIWLVHPMTWQCSHLPCHRASPGACDGMTDQTSPKSRWDLLAVSI